MKPATEHSNRGVRAALEVCSEELRCWTGRKREQEAAMALGPKQQCREGEDAKADAPFNFTPNRHHGPLSVEVFFAFFPCSFDCRQRLPQLPVNRSTLCHPYHHTSGHSLIITRPR
jgi:hypothetical protein